MGERRIDTAETAPLAVVASGRGSAPLTAAQPTVY
jgi:hypothetical protein